MSQSRETVTQDPEPGAGAGGSTPTPAGTGTGARTPAKKKARQIAKHLRGERPDYAYLKQVFKHLREELEVDPERAPKKLPYVPTEEEMRSFYEAVWKARRTQDVVLIKTLLYTGVRVSELVNIRLSDVDFDRCQVRVNRGKGDKDRLVPFPAAFKETLALHAAETERKGALYLFESSRKKKYTDRGVRKILSRYAEKAGLEGPISPHKMRHFLFTWLKKQGVDDALIQPYSGHESRRSLEVYSLLAIGEAQESYDEVMGRFPI